MNPRIDLYCLCSNDARLLPHFFRHYEPIVDCFHVYDHASTDDSLPILSRQPKARVRNFATVGDSLVDAARRLSNGAWRKSRGTADWVIVVEVDEFIFHPDLPAYLARCAAAGITALRGIGFEMVAREFPDGSAPLTDTITRGARSLGLDKLCAFRPDAVANTNFSPGRHQASPTGDIVWPAQREILLLRYRHLGIPYVIARGEEMSKVLREGDIKNGWGTHHLWTGDKIADEWSKLHAASEPVRGLGELSHLDPADYDEEAIVVQTGLMDVAWYLERYPDLAAAAVDPVAHFCVHGWRENRQPNLYFEPDWYLANHPAARLAGGNPLIHYARHGEPAGAWPSPGFDPAAYRRRYGLAEGMSPLRHFVANRQSVSLIPVSIPISDFDVIQYRKGGLSSIREPRDPSEEHVKRGREDPAGTAAGRETVMPSYREITEVLGFDLVTASNPVSVDPRTLLELIGRFIRQIEVDEDAYRREYPDVAAAIERGEILSARDHFLEFGYFEGRDPAPPAAEWAGRGP